MLLKDIPATLGIEYVNQSCVHPSIHLFFSGVCPSSLAADPQILNNLMTPPQVSEMAPLFFTLFDCLVLLLSLWALWRRHDSLRSDKMETLSAFLLQHGTSVCHSQRSCSLMSTILQVSSTLCKHIGLLSRTHFHTYNKQPSTYPQYAASRHD